MYQFMLWLVPTVEKFPRSQKFLIGDRIQSTALSVLESLVDATYTRGRDRLLTQADLGVEKLRFLFRLSKDLKLLDLRRYEHAARVCARGCSGSAMVRRAGDAGPGAAPALALAAAGAASSALPRAGGDLARQ